MPPATAGAADGIELGLMSHAEAAVEVLTSAFGSPCIEGLLRRKLRMSCFELGECFGIALKNPNRNAKFLGCSSLNKGISLSSEGDA